MDGLDSNQMYIAVIQVNHTVILLLTCICIVMLTCIFTFYTPICFMSSHHIYGFKVMSLFISGNIIPSSGNF